MSFVSGARLGWAREPHELRFRAAARTLTQAEATEAKAAGVAVAATKFGAVIRD